MTQAPYWSDQQIMEQAKQRNERNERIAQLVVFLSELADDPVLAEYIFALHPEFKEKLKALLLETPVIEHDDAPCTRVRHQG